MVSPGDAAAIASRSDPGPLSKLLVTVRVAANPDPVPTNATIVKANMANFRDLRSSGKEDLLSKQLVILELGRREETAQRYLVQS